MLVAFVNTWAPGDIWAGTFEKAESKAPDGTTVITWGSGFVGGVSDILSKISIQSTLAIWFVYTMMRACMEEKFVVSLPLLKIFFWKNNLIIFI